MWITLQILLTGLLSPFYFLFNTLIIIINETLYWNFNCNFNKLMLSNCTKSYGNSPIVLCLHLSFAIPLSLNKRDFIFWHLEVQNKFLQSLDSLDLLFTNTLVSDDMCYIYLPTMLPVNVLLPLRVLWPEEIWWENQAAISLWSRKQPVKKTPNAQFFTSVSTITNTKKRQEIVTVILNLTVFFINILSHAF